MTDGRKQMTELRAQRTDDRAREVSGAVGGHPGSTHIKMNAI